MFSASSGEKNGGTICRGLSVACFVCLQSAQYNGAIGIVDKPDADDLERYNVHVELEGEERKALSIKFVNLRRVDSPEHSVKNGNKAEIAWSAIETSTKHHVYAFSAMGDLIGDPTTIIS